MLRRVDRSKKMDVDAVSGKVQIQYWLEVVCRVFSHVLFCALTRLAKQAAQAFV